MRAYLAQFYPVHEFMRTTVGVEVEGRTSTSGKVVTKNSWRDVYQEADDEGDKEAEEGGSQRLPAMKQGDGVACTQATRRDAKTKPPARF